MKTDSLYFELKKKVDEYFDTVTPEQLKKDLDESGWDRYMGEEFNIEVFTIKGES